MGLYVDIRRRCFWDKRLYLVGKKCLCQNNVFHRPAQWLLLVRTVSFAFGGHFIFYSPLFLVHNSTDLTVNPLLSFHTSVLSCCCRINKVVHSQDWSPPSSLLGKHWDVTEFFYTIFYIVLDFLPWWPVAGSLHCKEVGILQKIPVIFYSSFFFKAVCKTNEPTVILHIIPVRMFFHFFFYRKITV